MIKKIIIVLAALSLLCAYTPQQSAEASYEAYYFENFNVDVVVNENYTFHITETIDTVFTEERHGIYRYLPNYWEEDRIKYTDISVKGAPYVVESDRYETAIRIGDPIDTVIGPITYTISYTVNLPKDSSSELDSVYINLIGFDHPTNTYNSKITITLPQKVSPSSISIITGYYYGYGDEEKISYEYADRQTLKISLLSPLDYYEGITVKINLPDGYFVGVKNPFFLEEALKYLLAVILIIAALVLWKIFGDDDKIIMPVEVSPPDVSPIEAGYIIDGKVNDEDIAAMLIYWASLGFISITQGKNNSDYTFKKLKDIKDRPQYEMNIFNGIFTESDNDKAITSDRLKSKLSSRLSSFKVGVHAKYNFQGAFIIDKKSKTFSRINALVAYICFSLTGFFMGLYNHIGLGIFLSMVFMLFFIPLHLGLNKILQYVSKRSPAQTLFRLFWYSLLIAGYVYVFCRMTHPWVLDVYQISFIILASCVIAAISFFTKKLSESGHNLFERVLGFRHFLITVEKDWLEELAEDTPEYYYSMLPYASVLGVSNVWISKFSKLAQDPPSWYVSTPNTRFSTRTFSSATVSNFKKIGIQSAKLSRVPTGSSTSYSRSSSSYSYRPHTTYTPRSSSSSFSSSRGRSGGGFSGGGSRSW